ncbi:unnamed protein product [Somion occarium]|uniref:C2 domain-containing protein n=1 Tax=Somion occarium TaxID=3059160 RepID=A0ABP1DE12_9APHY
MGLANGYLDPYIRAMISAEYGSSIEDEVPQSITYRTHTERRTLNPTFNDKWIFSGIPISGFTLTMRLNDEDPGNRDDHLGRAVVRLPPEGSELTEGWSSGDMECKIHKRKDSVKSRITTFVAKIATRGEVEHRCRVWISVKVLGRAQNQGDNRLYTVGPHRYFQHFSPLLGSFLGSTKAPAVDIANPSLKASTFIANRIQLTGPVPASLRHRYVGFAPFVKAMFKKEGIKGLLLHRALHKQHCSIYKWDKNVVWGVVEGINEKQDEKHEVNGKTTGDAEYTSEDKGDHTTDHLKEESVAFARQFLRMTSHGTHGRIFTYAIMLDGEWRFTETGKQFSIGLLSKHTMHTDVALEIAYSGEFFVRLLHPHSSEGSDDSPPDDPSFYELVIDNDSGTYRPSKDLLPVLQSYLSSPSNLGALGKITALDGFDEKLKRWKEKRAEIKALGTGKGRAIQASLSSSSSSSSDSSSSVSVDGVEGGRKVKESELRAALEEDANRARDNQDEDQVAKEEESVRDDEGNGGEADKENSK